MQSSFKKTLIHKTSVKNIKRFTPLVVFKSFILILIIQKVVHIFILIFYLLKPDNMMLLASNFILPSSLPLLFFKSRFFLSCQIQISVFQYFLVWPEPTVCWRNLLDDSLIQMIQLYCVSIETVLILNRKMAFSPNNFLFSVFIFTTN